MQLHLIRHGQTDWNTQRRIQGQLETELDATGRDQAKARGKTFVDMPLHAVYSSSSVRTRQTTELILGSRTDSVVFRDELKEINLGVWQGRFWSDVESTDPDMVQALNFAEPSFNVEGAESYHDLQRRGVKAIERILDEHQNAPSNSNILVVSHGALLKTIIAHYTNVPLSELPSYPSLPNCCHSILLYKDNSARFTVFNGAPIEQSDWPAST